MNNILSLEKSLGIKNGFGTSKNKSKYVEKVLKKKAKNKKEKLHQDFIRASFGGPPFDLENNLGLAYSAPGFG